jgi:hypothetical protein
MRHPQDLVTEDDTRSGGGGAGRPDKCFYCTANTGTVHDWECVCLTKAVKVRMTVELIIERPRSWGKDDIESHLNESSWCSNNILDEIKHYTKEDSECLCFSSQFEYLGDATNEEARKSGLLNA